MGWMTSSGVSIYYEVSGRGPRSLILVHELGGTLDSWDAVLPLLEPEFRVLRFDQRGSGLSEKVRKPFTIAHRGVGVPLPGVGGCAWWAGSAERGRGAGAAFVRRGIRGARYRTRDARAG